MVAGSLFGETDLSIMGLDDFLHLWREKTIEICMEFFQRFDVPSHSS